MMAVAVEPKRKIGRPVGGSRLDRNAIIVLRDEFAFSFGDIARVFDASRSAVRGAYLKGLDQA
jgi:hypothetical protein